MALTAWSCASHGPIFRRAPAPDGDRALLYVYRADEVRSGGAIELFLDGRRVGRLGNEEYLWFHLNPGIHQLRTVYVARWIGSGGWNRVRVEADVGGRYFLKIWSDYIAVERAPDRAQDMVSVNAFASLQPEKSAVEELALTRLGTRAD